MTLGGGREARGGSSPTSVRRVGDPVAPRTDGSGRKLACWAVTQPGLERVLIDEIEALGIQSTATETGGAAFEGTERDLQRANLHLRTANRVLVRVGDFTARGFGELERKAATLPWERFLSGDVPAAFRVTCARSKLRHRRGIGERLRRAAGGVPLPERAAEAQVFVVRVHRDRVTVSADASGEGLDRRGYRVAGAKAPLRETLAAGLLLAAGWTPDRPLIDPMCGSGTIPIEAALIARGIPSGWHRRFAFQRWPGFDPDLWRRVRSEAEEGIRGGVTAPLVGSDRDRGAVDAAQANARRAGVPNDVDFTAKAISGLEAPEGRTAGWIVTNPPYGRRIGDPRALRDLYAALGNVIRNRTPGWRIALVSADRRLDGQTRLALNEVLRTRSGGVPVRFVVGGVRDGGRGEPQSR